MRSVRDLPFHIDAVTVKNIAGKSCSLRLPVEPDPHQTVVDMIVVDLCVDQRVQLDRADLVAPEFALVRDMEDLVSVDLGIRAAHVTDDAAFAKRFNERGAVTDLVRAK